eukprot:UN31716
MKPLYSFQLKRTHICYASCFQDGNDLKNLQLVSADCFSQIYIWQPWNADKIKDGCDKSRLVLQGRSKGAVFDLQWCRNYIISVADDRTVRLWKQENDGLTCIFHGQTHKSRVLRCWGSLLSDYFLTVGEDSRICVWKIDENNKDNLVTQIADLQDRHGSQIWSVCGLDFQEEL